MTTKDDVMTCHLRNRDWTFNQIAEHLGCSSGYVRATAYRYGLSIPNRDKPEIRARRLRQKAVALMKQADEIEASAREVKS